MGIPQGHRRRLRRHGGPVSVDPNDPVLQDWMRVFPGTVNPRTIFPTRCAPTSEISRTCSRFSASCSRSATSRAARVLHHHAFWSVPSDPTNDTNPSQPPFYVLVGDQQNANHPSGWPPQWSASTENSSPPTSLALGSGELRQAHRAAAANRYADARPGTIQNSMISDARVRPSGLCSSGPTGSSTASVDASDRRRAAVCGAALHRTHLDDAGQLDVPQLSRCSELPRTSRRWRGQDRLRTDLGRGPRSSVRSRRGRVATAPGGDAATAPPPETGRPPRSRPPRSSATGSRGFTRNCCRAERGAGGTARGARPPAASG